MDPKDQNQNRRSQLIIKAIQAASMQDDPALDDTVTQAKAFAEASHQSFLKAEQCYKDAVTLLEADVALHQKNLQATALKQKGQPLRQYLEGYYSYSASASENNRKIAFAGIAIVWVFKSIPTAATVPTVLQNNLPTLPAELVLPLLLLSCSLAIDLLQYLLGTIFWGTFYEKEFKRIKNDVGLDENTYMIEAPKARSIPLTILFFLKFIPTITAYTLIFVFLKNKLF